MDRLHPNRERIEAMSAEREKTLFNLDHTLYLYDLTSTYFEGQILSNLQASRSYSRGDIPADEVSLGMDRQNVS